jgi:predicted MPP superfamily phosphohydrolase
VANTLTWLHLSDLHMRRDELDNLRVVLDALWEDLPAQIDELGGLDFIAFTGDIAHSGEAEEYALAEKHFFGRLLEVTDLTADKLVIVPGNHDVDWDLVSLINPDIPFSLTSRDEVAALLRNDARRRLLFQSMANYAQFIQRFFAKSPDHQMLHDPLYSYVQPIASETPSVALIGLNSAWLSGFHKNSRGNVADRGNLLIGDRQVGDALKKAENATVRIALVHHPPSWLKEFDEGDVKRWLRAGCHFVLLGHLHVPEFIQEKALGGETIDIPAGTIYESREWLNGYNLVQLNFDTGRGKIILRRYSEQRREWVKDVQSTGDQWGGLVEFELPGELGQPEPSPSRPRSLASQVLSEIKPSWLRLGRERETQLLESFLQQEAGDTLWIWGNDDCGLTEFLQIARALFQHRAADVIYFDAEDAAFGIAVDQYYFLERLERWANPALEISPRQTTEGIDKRLERLLATAEERLARSDRRLVLVLANYHLLLPVIRKWVLMTWGQMLESLGEHKLLAIFACEGSAPSCPASDQQNKIYLGEFTVQDIERFLHTSSVDPQEVSELAREIHSKSTDEFLATPRRVYRNLIAQAIHRGWISVEVPPPTMPAVGQTSGTGHRRDTATSVLQKKIETQDFDVFLCHNSEDKPTVKEIGERLKERGILPWLDEWELRPGLPWQRLLEEQIGQIKSAAVFVGQSGVGPWQQLELEAFLREFVDRSCPVIPVLLSDVQRRPKLPIFLKGMTWVDFRRDDPDPMEHLVWGITGERDKAF